MAVRFQKTNYSNMLSRLRTLVLVVLTYKGCLYNFIKLHLNIEIQKRNTIYNSVNVKQNILQVCSSLLLVKLSFC